VLFIFQDNQAGGGASVQNDYYGTVSGKCITSRGNSVGTYGRAFLNGSSAGAATFQYASFLTQLGQQAQDVYSLFGYLTVSDSYLNSPNPYAGPYGTYLFPIRYDPNNQLDSTIPEICKSTTTQVTVTPPGGTITTTPTLTPTSTIVGAKIMYVICGNQKIDRDGMNVRESASTNAKLVASLPPAAPVLVLEPLAYADTNRLSLSSIAAYHKHHEHRFSAYDLWESTDTFSTGGDMVPLPNDVHGCYSRITTEQ
jgi:hypothetical protein